jgi:hypothetical protein
VHVFVYIARADRQTAGKLRDGDDHATHRDADIRGFGRIRPRLACHTSQCKIRRRPTRRVPTLAGRTIEADRIGLPSAGGKIASAEIATLTAANGASASYCKVMAQIAPIDPKSHPINIEINLPLDWNGKAVQYGGGGFNGVHRLRPRRKRSAGDPGVRTQ